MALLKSIQTTGTTNASYWRITAVFLNELNKTARIHICGYFDEQARRDNLDVIQIKLIQNLNDNYDQYFSVETLNAESNNPIKTAYLYVKAMQDSEFADAIDV